MTQTESDNLIAAPAPAPAAKLSPAMKTILAVTLGHALIDMTGGVWPIFKTLAELDLYWAGMISTITTMTAMSLQPLFGLYADRGHSRQLLVGGAALTCVMVLLGPIAMLRPVVGNATVYVLLFITLLLIRLGQAMYHPPGTSLVGNSSTRRRSTFVALFITAGMIGFSTSWLIFSKVYRWADGQTLWLLLLLVPIMIAVWAWCRPVEVRDRKRQRLWAAVKELSHLRGQLVALFLVQALMAGLNTALTFLLPELARGRGYPDWLVYWGGNFMLVFGAVLMMVPTSHIADRVGRRGTQITLCFLTTISYSVLMFHDSASPLVYALLLMLCGGLMGSTNPVGVAMAQHITPKSESLISGIMMGLAWALGSISQTIVGYLAERSGGEIEPALRWMLIAGVASTFLAMTLPKAADAHD